LASVRVKAKLPGSAVLRRREPPFRSETVVGSFRIESFGPNILE
jgi:hypothetical protein